MSTRLLVLSDLHLEWAEYAPPAAATFDVVVLAGDICQGPQAVAWARDRFASSPVVLVPGNHEYYGLEFKSTRDLMRQTAAGSNVHVLDRSDIVVDGVRFLGATLWTDFAVQGPDIDAAMDAARESLSDFAGKIRLDDGEGPRRFMPEDSAREHVASRTWLAERLAEATVVVTHHAPSARSIAPQWEGNRLNPCFASDLPADMFEGPRLWIHGHVHDSFDYRIGTTRVLANPRGYRMRHGGFENVRFDPGLIIDLP